MNHYVDKGNIGEFLTFTRYTYRGAAIIIDFYFKLAFYDLIDLIENTLFIKFRALSML